MRPVSEAAALMFFNLCTNDRCIGELLSAHNVATVQEFRSFLTAVNQKLAPPVDDENIPPPSEN